MSAFVKLIENPFEENKEKNFTIKNNTPVSEIEGFDKQRSVVYVNGRHVTNDYILRKNDVCVIRNYPAEATTVFAVIGIVALFGIALAGTDIMLKTFNGEGIWDSLHKELHPENKNTTNQEQVETLPTLSGGKNQSALGKSIPLILGKTLFTPYTIGLPYNTISGKDGEEQYYHSLFLIGYNDIEIRNVSIGLEELASNDENVTDGALSITSSKYRDLQLELRQSGEVSLYNCKVVQENFSAELLHPQAPEGETSIGVYVYAFSARYPKQVEIEFTFSGLIAYDKESGEEKETEVDVTVEYSLDGGKTWINCSELIDLSNATGSSVYVNDGNYIKFKNKKAQTLRYVLRQSFTKSDMDNCYAKVVQYRILRTNESSTETTVIDKIYFSAIRTWCYNASLSTTTLENQIPMNAKERDKTARLGLSIKVTKDLVNSFDKINLIAYSKAPVWDGRGWTNNKEVTRNPIALALHVMTGNFRDEAYRYNFTEYEGYYSSNKIDLESFGEAYEMCEEIKDFGEGIKDKKYLCDGAVLSSTKTIDLVNKILACARSSLVLNGNKYEIFTDKEQDYPLLVLNNNNLLSLSYTKNFNDIPDGQQVRYISERNYYQQDTIVVKPLGSSPVSSSDNLHTVEYPYITDPYHAKAMSLYQQACLSLRPESYLAEVTTEGGLAEIGSLIEIQSDRLLIGIGEGAEITRLITEEDDMIIGIETDGKFIVTDKTKIYGVVINIVDELGLPKTLKRRLSLNNTGTYSYFYFETPISTSAIEKPEVGCVLSFGFYEKETMETICIGKSEKGDGKYELTLVPYEPEVFRADEGMIVDFDPKVTPPRKSGMPISYGDKTVPVSMLDLNAVRSELIHHISDLSEYTIQLSMSAIGSNVSIVVYKDGSLAYNTLYFQDFYGTGSNEPSTAGESGEIMDGHANIKSVADANKHIVKVYSDEEMLDLVGTAFVSYGSTGSGSDSTSYWMIEDATSIKCNSRGNFIPSKINVSCKKQTGRYAPESYTGRIKIEYSTDGSTYTQGYSGDASSKEYTISANTKSLRVSMYVAGGTTVLLDQDVIPVVNDGTDGGYQDYQFAVGDFGLSDEQARALDWYDAPPQVPDGKCLYMATKFIGA